MKQKIYNFRAKLVKKTNLNLKSSKEGKKAKTVALQCFFSFAKVLILSPMPF